MTPCTRQDYRTLLQDNLNAMGFIEKLNKFFSDHYEEISDLYIYNVKTSRELWLQGELFLSDKEHIRVNEARLFQNSNRRTDISYYHNEVNLTLVPDVVAEIKLISSASTGPYRFWNGQWSVRNDMARLRDSDAFANDNPLHLMIVVIASSVAANRTEAEIEARRVFLEDDPPPVEGLEPTEILGVDPQVSSGTKNIHVRIWKIKGA